MAVTINSWSTTPPGGWKYKVPETGRWIPENSNRGMGHWAFNDLESEIVRYYKANGLLAPSDLRQRIIDQMCERMPPGICKDSSRSSSWGRNLLNEFNRVVQGTTTLIDWWVRDGGKHISVEESAQRAAICSTCIFNSDPQGCTGCNMKVLTSMADRIIGGTRQPFDAQLRSCTVCGCGLSAKVRIDKETLRRHLTAEQINQLPPAHNGFAGCWLREQEPVHA